MAAALLDSAEDRFQFPRAHSLGEMKTRRKGGGPDAWQLRLERGPNRIAEAARRFHDDVDRKAAAAKAGLTILPFELCDRVCNTGSRCLPYTGPAMDHTVDGREAEPDWKAKSFIGNGLRIARFSNS